MGSATMSEHRHPRAITPPTGVISDAEMISRLNAQLLAANAALEAVRARNRELDRVVEIGKTEVERQRLIILQNAADWAALRAEHATVQARCHDLDRKVAELMCWQVGAFVDGDLDTERADAFREHLDGCAKCQAEVLAQQQMKARLSTLEPTNG